MFTPKGMRRQHSRLGLSVNSPKTPLRSVANDSIISSPIGTPGRSNEATSVPIKVYELLKSGDKVSCGILPGGIGLAISNDTIMLWKLNNTMKLYSLPIPANYACKPQNVAVIGYTVCFVSTTGTGRFWANMESPTKWIEFKITLDRDDLINALHGDANKIGAVSTRGVLFNIYVQSGVVNYNTHRLPSKNAGLVRRVSSIFWSSQGEETDETSHSKSLLVGGIFVICVNQMLYAWDLAANVNTPRLSAPFTDVFGSAKLESIAGNDKYIGFLVRVDEDDGEELHRLISPIDELIVSPSNCDRAEIKLGPSVTENERAQKLNLILPYLSQVGVTTTKNVWLSNEKCVTEDVIQAVGAFDGQIALLTTKGLRLYKTQQRLETAQMDQTLDQPNQIETLEQLSKSELPQERLQAAVSQYNQGNNSEAEQLLATIGALDQVAKEVSTTMIDEIPAHDPRWSRSKLGAGAVNAQNSLLIQRQLQEKQAKHRLFVNFLKDRLSDEALDSLAQDGEKIELATKLRTAASNLQSQLDQAIRVLIQQRKITMQLGLTHQDHFYQKVSETHQIVSVISQLMENTIINSKDRIGKVSFEAIEIIQKMNSIVCIVINSCREYREKFNITEGRRPWSTVLQEALIELLKLNGDNNIPTTIPACIDELVTIAKFVLSDRLEHHKSNGESNILSEESEFGQLRAQLVGIFLEAESFGEAAVLSEQFHDFATLLKLYELEKNDKKLAQYLQLPNFAEYVFQKYKGEKLVKMAARHGGRLAELVSADAQHGWLLSVELKQLPTATTQLVAQAEVTNENSLSKRTLLSIAKLTAIASGAPSDQVETIKQKEVLLNYQDRLPDKLLHVSSGTPALDSLDIIDGMTSGNVAQMNLTNGRDALDLLELVNQNDKEQMKSLIWSRLIESEINSATWKNALGNSHQPVEALRGTKFASLLNKANEEELPTVDALRSQSELADFGENAVFAFIIGAAIEARRGELCEMSA